MLVSTVYHHESPIGMWMLPPSWTFLLPHPIPLGCHRVPDLSSLHQNSKFPLVISFTSGNVYIFMLFSQLSHSPLPPLCPHVCSLRLHLHWDYCLVAKSCPTLCDPMDCSTPGCPIPLHLPEFAQVHVQCIGDAIQPSQPLSPSSSVFGLSQHQDLFQWTDCLHQVAKVLELQHWLFHWVFRIDFL